MNNLNTRQTNRRGLVVFVACVSVLAAIFGIMTGAAQTPEKEEREVVDKIPKHLPIKIKVKKEKEEKVKDLKNEEWLGELEVEVKNTGTKPIYYLDIVLFMPDDFAPSGVNLGCMLKYGRAELISISEPVRADDVPIKPGEVAVLMVPAHLVEGWKRGRDKGELTNPKKIEFLFGLINFGDGTGFSGTDGVSLPDIKERGAKAPCAGGDSAGEAASVKDPPRYHFPELASIASFLPRPVSLTPAFFIPEGSLPEPGAMQDLCCGSGCSRLREAIDQGCPCPGVTRRIIQHTSCSDPAGACGTVRFVQMQACIAGGIEYYCEEGFRDATCRAAPTPTPTPCIPSQPAPDPTCCSSGEYQIPGTSQRFCRWLCTPDTSTCGIGTVFADGCYSVRDDAPVICQEGFEPYYSETYGSACCPTQTAGCGEGCQGDVPENGDGDTIGQQTDGGPCPCSSPILIDVLGDGFRLTDFAGGVFFDLDANGRRGRISWTAAGSDDSWLALDRNGNGMIEDGRELFGNHTPQAQPPAGASRNGFLALAEFDRAAAGGNSDGLIDAKDAVYSRLLLWRDENHDGVSQASELRPLAGSDVVRLHLDYKESKRADEYGNRFRYRAKADDAKGLKVGRWAWDVFLFSKP